MALTAQQIAEQRKDVEELIAVSDVGFAQALFGTKEQQAKWLPGLYDGSKLCAFALTEPEAGSDAGNVQTTATPTEDGSAYILNGTKHFITNGGIAHLLTVMARTPDPSNPK